MARLFRENGDTETAVKLVETILADNPNDIRALRLAASLARERGVSGEAASAVLLDRAVEASWQVAADAALVLLDRARLRWNGGNSDDALEDLHRARAFLHGEGAVAKAIETLHGIISEVAQ